ncbi:hypothetical protein ACS0TY_000213 [Phlomoides rotata]
MGSKSKRKFKSISLNPTSSSNSDGNKYALPSAIHPFPNLEGHSVADSLDNHNSSEASSSRIGVPRYNQQRYSTLSDPNFVENYFKEVKDTFQYQTEKYDRFLKVMTDSNDERIGLDDVASVVKVLFKGYPNLILGFNIFLPVTYEITVDDEEEEAPLVS